MIINLMIYGTFVGAVVYGLMVAEEEEEWK